MGLLTWLLGSCGASTPQAAGDTFVTNATAGLDAVPNVVTSTVRYTDPGGMGATITVRVTASPTAELETVLGDSLRAFSSASGALKPLSPVYFYVFPEGAQETGIRPDALGLDPSPTVEAIRGFANK
ncbi:hypothetical protein AAGW05_02645 [Arthrobacter sp. LAPM80]|uniref:hypothetical protein n=1 Tax=Arthrobacter sp. LAPM80 TaxID=3141788 RepID=UPI00398A5677